MNPRTPIVHWFVLPDMTIVSNLMHPARGEQNNVVEGLQADSKVCPSNRIDRRRKGKLGNTDGIVEGG